MRLLLDQNISHKLCALLDRIFEQCSHVREFGLATASDERLWDFAEATGFIVVTLDRDFVDLAGRRGPPPKLVWLRCRNRPTAEIAAILNAERFRIAAFARDPDQAVLQIA